MRAASSASSFDGGDQRRTGAIVESINSMSRQLRSMREQLIQGERTRLVAQLTAGFGHQLRNGLAGARLAIELHQSRCTSAIESSLVVARNQLALVEEEIQGLYLWERETSVDRHASISSRFLMPSAVWCPFRANTHASNCQSMSKEPTDRSWDSLTDFVPHS